MKPFTPYERLAEHQREPLAALVRTLVEEQFDRVALADRLGERVAALEPAVRDDDDAWRLAGELEGWVRWWRPPAYCVTYVFQELTKRRGSIAHVGAAVLFSDAQTSIAEDMSLHSLEVALDSLGRVEAAVGPEAAAGLAAARAGIVGRLRVHHEHYARWSRPFGYGDANPLTAHLYDERVRAELAGAYPDAGSPAELVAAAEEAEDAYHWLVARRIAAHTERDHAAAEAQFRACLADARELGLEAEIGHLLRHQAYELRELGDLQGAAAALEQALAHEQPVQMLGYWYGLTARELGDVRALRAGGRDGGLDSALAAYGPGRRVLDIVLAAGGPPVGTTVKRQLLRSYADNAVQVALARRQVADALAELAAGEPRQLGEALGEVRAAAALPGGRDFLRAREVFHRHLTSVPDSFEDYLETLPQEYAARRRYTEARHGMFVLGGRSSDEVVERLLAHGGLDRLVLAFHIGPMPTCRALLLDLAAGTLEECVLGAVEAPLRAAHEAYVAALDATDGLLDPGPATRAALDGLLAACGTLLAPALELLRERAAGRALTVVPRVQLSAVPFHALALPGGGRLVDHCAEISCVPTLGLLADLLDAAPAPPGPDPGVTALHDTAGTPLFAGTLRALGAARPARTLADPDPAAAMAAIQSAAGADVFLACHGDFSPERPGASYLSLGGPEPLSLSAASAELALPACRSVTLGACESGQARAELGSEYLGLAGVLLSAGVPRVIASLWKVNQLSTAILLADCLAAMGAASPAAALTAAQRRLRDMTADAAGGWLDLNLPALAPALRPLVAELGERPFSHPDLWAGFYAAGL